MSNWLAGIIGAAIGVLLGGIVTSCFALKAIRAAEKKVSTQYQEGYEIGYEYGYKVGVKWISTLVNNKVKQNPIKVVGDKITIDPKSYRVDVAPGFDSVREGKHAPSD